MRYLTRYYTAEDTVLLTATVNAEYDFDPPTEKKYLSIYSARYSQYWNSKEDMDTQEPSSIDTYNGLIMHIRNDTANQKVYVLNWHLWYLENPPNHPFETLLYDYSLKPGDMVPYNDWTPNETGNFIQDVFYEKRDGYLIKMFKVISSEPNAVPNTFYYADHIGGMTRYLSYYKEMRLINFKNNQVDIDF